MPQRNASGWIPLLAITTLLGACGGRTSEPGSPQAFVAMIPAAAPSSPRLRILASTATLAATADVAPVITNDQLFAYAERSFPTLFDGTPSVFTNVVFDGRSYSGRYYPGSGSYLAVSGGEIWGLGPFTNHRVQGFGSVQGYATLVCSVISCSPTSTPPNILFVIADDFGLDASPCHSSIGANKPTMPNLAALCQRGVVFDRAWAHPTCTPTRASVLSGQYGIHSNVMAVDEALPTTTPTLLQRLAEGPNPYAVAVIGKWHVAGANPNANSPALLGAQHYAGFLTGALSDYFSWRITVNGSTSTTTTYATTELTNQAIAWVAAQQDKPWFLWLAYNAPHAPFHTPPAALHTQAGLKNGTATDARTMYFAAAEALDGELGRLLASLPAAVLANTTIVFMGDNGTPQAVVQAPFSRTKAKDSLYEGGIRVPLVVAGAGVLRSGQREQALVNSTDLFATLATLAQRPHALPSDSVSFAPALSDAGFGGRSHAYIDFRQNAEVISAIRDTRYKLIELQAGRRELYDLDSDPYENTNLLANGSTAALDVIVNALLAQRTAMQR